MKIIHDKKCPTAKLSLRRPQDIAPTFTSPHSSTMEIEVEAVKALLKRKHEGKTLPKTKRVKSESPKDCVTVYLFRGLAGPQAYVTDHTDAFALRLDTGRLSRLDDAKNIYMRLRKAVPFPNSVDIENSADNFLLAEVMKGLVAEGRTAKAWRMGVRGSGKGPCYLPYLVLMFGRKVDEDLLFVDQFKANEQKKNEEDERRAKIQEILNRADEATMEVIEKNVDDLGLKDEWEAFKRTCLRDFLVGQM